MRVPIGNQTSCWAATPTQPFDYAIAQGFDAFEWFPDKKPAVGWDGHDLPPDTRKALRETASARGVRLSVHARWQANPFSAEGLDLLLEDLELARDLGAVLFNLHLFHERGIATFVRAILPLIDKTAETHILLSIENTPLHSPEQFNELFSQLRATNSSDTRHVGMCLDLGHANLSSTTQNNYLGFCDRLDPQLPIIHVHLHENWGDTDSHLPLFTGPAGRDDSGVRGLLRRLEARAFSGAIILEQWPQPPSLLNQARDRLLRLLEPGDASPAAHNNSRVAQAPEPQSQSNGSLTEIESELVAGDRVSTSWRQKLEMVSQLLTQRPTFIDEQLADIATYLRFLGTGQIACAEDGRHFRPAHHARIASQVQQRLAQLSTPDNQLILRKIYPLLPSSAPAFQRPEPLTRIRDIAHRNDIGSDLKREIKTTLQNKLHRCAGPEDLVTSAALLERITAPGANYPSAFVEQFKLFHEELKQFFNAQSLDERLKALLPRLEAKPAELVRQLLQQKSHDSMQDRLATLRISTELRHEFVNRISPNEEGQEFVLADIALEDFAFVVLSQLINDCEKAKTEEATNCRLESLGLGLDHLSLSGVDAAESHAANSELQAWGKVTNSSECNEVLRLKATVSRCRRLADEFATRTVTLFAGPAARLGQALGVAEHASRVLAEADIRRHVAFQVSKLADSLLRTIREWLRLPPWDVVVAGRTVGRVKSLNSFDEWDRASDGPAVVLLKHAEGDEEIPKEIVAIVLSHEIPHLSHLGVRARQAGVVFVTCEDPSEFERIQKMKGGLVSLSTFPDKVTWEIAGDQNARPRLTPSVLRIPQARLSPKVPLIPIEAAVLENSGGKSDGARRLAELSRKREAEFLTPAAMVIPFGVMEDALGAVPEVAMEYWELIKTLDKTEAANVGEIAARLRGQVQKLVVPESIVSELQKRFPSSSALMVRSSANSEDLEAFAGAGLYESVPNVSSGNAAAAIRTVWSSLWTERAAQGRRAAGIPQEQAHMAVLVEEFLSADLSFVLHTVDPITHEAGKVYAEIVIGLGETLVSASAKGSPYRLTGDKQSGAVTTLAFANFSSAARPDAVGGVMWKTVDYSRIDLSRDAGALEKLGRRLTSIGAVVERSLGAPQDIEGALVGGKVFLVQARAQQGLEVR